MSLINNVLSDPFFNTAGFGTTGNWGGGGVGNITGDMLGFPGFDFGGGGLSSMGNLNRPLMSTLRPTLGNVAGATNWRMSMDILDTDKEYIVLAEVPGVPKDKIHVTIENNILYIQCEKQQPLV